ncbi:hypothetical protein TWF694_001478 [Orbilia ellipsospora]|uniref:C2H2-type domain-containing protein n=1 Tax=Orbilia ellipsospora TaxID=2528407 RepID=A0AAV9XRP1_9PEZI
MSDSSNHYPRFSNSAPGSGHEGSRQEQQVIETLYPDSPQLRVQTNQSILGNTSAKNTVPNVVLSPRPGYYPTSNRILEDSSSRMIIRDMPPPPRPNTGKGKDNVETINPSMLSMSSPEEVRIMRGLRVEDTPSPRTIQQLSPLEYDDQEVFQLDESTFHDRNPLFAPTEAQTYGRPGLLSYPTEHRQKQSTRGFSFPPPDEFRSQSRNSGISQNPHQSSILLSSSEGTKPFPGRSIKVMASPIDRFECCCCQAAFIAQKNLEMHFAKTHKGRHNHFTELEYSCSICGEGFRSRKDLDTHQLVCGVVPRVRRGKKTILQEQRFSVDSHPLRYSAGSLSPAAIDIPSSGRDSQLSLASITSTPSDFELSDFNPADDEPTTIQKLVQKAKKQTMNAIRKAGSTETEPISPTKRRKSNTTNFAKNVAKNVSKALEAGLIKMEDLSENAPTEAQGNTEGPSERGFKNPKSSKGKRSKDQSPFVNMLACPYAKGDPQKYLTCLLIHRRDMPGIREHLGRVHFGGSTPDDAIRSKDWSTLFLFCFKDWVDRIPNERFDYRETIQLLQILSLGEPMNKFLRDLEKHLTVRRTQELQEMEAIYRERNWRKYQEFLTRAHIYDEPPPPTAGQSSPPLHPPFEPSQIQEYRPDDLVASLTLVVCRSTEVFLNREVYYPFPLGYFNASFFKVWLDGVFDPPISFTDNHLVIREYNTKFFNLQDLEGFLNFEVPMRLNPTRRPQDDAITVVIYENWPDEYLNFTPGHH